MIPVVLQGKDGFTTVGLLDSGADISAMPLAMAEALELDLSAKRTKAFGIGGNVDSIHSYVRITLEKGHEKYTFQMPVMVICDEYQFPMILGRKGFFSNFIITFDEENERVTIKKR
jgi:hypothetical protein